MFNNDGGFTMPVVPAYGGTGGSGNFLGGDGIWAILLFALIFGGFGGGFGMGGFGGWGMMGMGMMDGFGLYPWLNNSQNINDGFRDQMLNTTVQGIQNGITSGFGDVQTALCGGFAGVNASINGAQNAIAQQLYSNEIGSLNRSFAEQTAMSQGFNAVQGQLAQASSDNRLGVADLKYTVATENCADRAASAQNTQSIITAITAGIQSIKDDLCADRLAAAQRETEAERRENANLRSQLNMAAMQNGLNNEVDALYNRLNNCPVPSVPVYGKQPIFSCGQQGCGSF